MTVNEDTAHDPTDDRIERPVMPGPLETLFDSLRVGGCPLAGVEADLYEVLDSHDPKSVEADRLMTWIRQTHLLATDLRLGPVISELLDRAHIEDWPQVRKRIFEVEEWPRIMRYDQAREEFHRITNLLVLCVVCHRLFDRKLIPERIVLAAQQHMWAMPIAEDALRRFIKTSLSFYGGHRMDSTNVALAVDLLYQYHGARQPFAVGAWPVKLRGTSFVVDPEHRKIGWRALDNTTGR